MKPSARPKEFPERSGYFHFRLVFVSSLAAHQLAVDIK
jgi:hypothetical protein